MIIRYLDELSIYPTKLIIRINNEGFEDDCILSAINVFGDIPILVLGSTKDILQVKGRSKLEELHNKLESYNIKFVKFDPVVHSWPEALKSIVAMLADQ